ncbi:MAG: hypothetical protein WBQ50_16640 [Nocardioides sp.]
MKPDSRNIRTLVSGLVVVLGAAVVATLAMLGPAQGGNVTASDEEHGPALVEPVAGSDLSSVTLTERASERLDIQTAPTQASTGSNDARVVVPYASLLYDAQGDTWVYTNPDPLVFVRAAVDVRSIDGDEVRLDAGPEAGVLVVTVGAAELYGAELGVGH